MPIDADEVKRIANLAKLDLDAREVELFRGQLQSILDHVAILGEVEATGALDVAEPSPKAAALREDQPEESLGTPGALRNATGAAEGHFRVPRVLGE